MSGVLYQQYLTETQNTRTLQPNASKSLFLPVPKMIQKCTPLRRRFPALYVYKCALRTFPKERGDLPPRSCSSNTTAAPGGQHSALGDPPEMASLCSKNVAGTLIIIHYKRLKNAVRAKQPSFTCMLGLRILRTRKQQDL